MTDLPSKEEMSNGVPVALSAPSYDLAYNEFLRDVYYGFVAADPILGGIARVSDPHAGPIRNVRGEQPLDQPMVAIGATMTLPINAVRSGDVEAHTAMVAEFSAELLAEQSKQFFRNMGEMSSAAGTTIQNVGHGIPTIEQMRELISRMEFEFDESGKVKGMQLIVDPSQRERVNELLQLIENDPECRRIMLQKRAEWMKIRAERSRRTLSR